MLWDANCTAKWTYELAAGVTRKFNDVHRKLPKTEKEKSGLKKSMFRGERDKPRSWRARMGCCQQTNTSWSVLYPEAAAHWNAARGEAPDPRLVEHQAEGPGMVGHRATEGKARRRQSWGASPAGRPGEVRQSESDNKKGNGQQHAWPFCVHHAQRKNRLQLLRDILCEHRLTSATYFITVLGCVVGKLRGKKEKKQTNKKKRQVQRLPLYFSFLFLFFLLY